MAEGEGNRPSRRQLDRQAVFYVCPTPSVIMVIDD